MQAAPAQTFYHAALWGMLASGFLAVLGSGELDAPTAVGMTAALILRALALAGWWRARIPAVAVTAVSAAYLLFYAVDFFWLSRSFVTATVHLLFFVAAVKLLTAASVRDHAYVKLIAGLELLAAALLSAELSFFVYLAVFLTCTIAAFASGEMVRATGQAVRVSRFRAAAVPAGLGLMTTSLFCAILLMTAALFFVLPRTARAAFQRFVPQRYHVPGFGSEITLGEIGGLKQNRTAVMHVRSYDDAPLVGLRWRGSALVNFDGKRWFNSPAREQRLPVISGQILLPALRRTRPGRELRYAVELSNIASDTLYFAGAPQTISVPVANLYRASSGALRVPRLSMAGLRYGAASRIENEWASPLGPVEPLPDEERRTLLEVPVLDPRVAELSRIWTAETSAPEEAARALERRFQQDFGYSLELFDQEVRDPLAHFLFVRKQGHCEYFASAMAVMLRTLGIPSRVATGFLGGEFNPISGWQVIRASDAHSWVEAWIPSRGWVTFDPTPSDPEAAQSGRWSQASLLFDAADQFWRDWVLTYDLDHQVALAARMQGAGRNWGNAATSFDFAEWFARQAALLIAVASVLTAAFLLRRHGPSWWAWWRRRRRLERARSGVAEPSDATLLYERMLQLLERRGFQKPAWLTPQEFARVLPPSELALLVGDMTAAYNRVRFGGQRDAAPQMARLLQRIEHAS